MVTTTGTHAAVRFSILAVLIALTAVLPDQSLVHAKRAALQVKRRTHWVWLYLVYCVGYRLWRIRPYVIILFICVLRVAGRGG
jgi:hypothetical protein